MSRFISKRRAFHYLSVGRFQRGGAMLLAAFALAGCAEHRAGSPQLADTTVRPEAAVAIFFVDGMAHDRFHDLLERGLLPNIEARFVAGGVGVEHAVVCLPAVTYANAVSLITGRFPGHHGIMGNQWFDRERLLLRDYGSASTYRRANDDFECATLYELLDDRFTVNVQGHTRRGVTVTIDNWAASGIDWFLKDFSDVDERVGRRVDEVVRLANRHGVWPSVYMSYFPGVDEIGHLSGPDDEEYAEALIEADRAIGRVIDTLEAVQPAERMYYVLVTDHGLVPIHDDQVLYLGEWLEENRSLRVHEGEVQAGWKGWRRLLLAESDAVLTNEAFRRGAIHLRGAEEWEQPAPAGRIREIVEAPVGGGRALRDVPGIGLVCWRDGADRVRVDSRDGSALIERRTQGRQVEYRLTAERGDALPYGRSPELAAFVAEGWHGSRAWLAATCHTEYPDFVPQVVEMFDSPKSGDVVVFAADEWSFEGSYRGGHGSCRAEDMRIPMYFAGPSLPRGGQIPNARLVDVMPTVLDLLGEGDRAQRSGPIDGVSVKEMLMTAPGGGLGLVLPDGLEETVGRQSASGDSRRASASESRPSRSGGGASNRTDGVRRPAANRHRLYGS